VLKWEPYSKLLAVNDRVRSLLSWVILVGWSVDDWVVARWKGGFWVDYRGKAITFTPKMFMIVDQPATSLSDPSGSQAKSPSETTSSQS